MQLQCGYKTSAVKITTGKTPVNRYRLRKCWDIYSDLQGVELLGYLQYLGSVGHSILHHLRTICVLIHQIKLARFCRNWIGQKQQTSGLDFWSIVTSISMNLL